MEVTQTAVLQLSAISKRFGAVQANDGISLELYAGEMLALLGENGAGKSTLMAILFGHYMADSGTIHVHGQRLPAGNPRAALNAGIGMVHQHFALAEQLSVLDNVLLGTEPLWRLYSRRGAARQRLQQVAQRFGLHADADARVADLSVGERQRVEILKALYRGASILILDEPTAVLTPQESQALMSTLRQMMTQGLSILLISHKLDEVLQVSQRLAVLRQGRLVAQMPTASSSPAQIVAAMVGHSIQTASHQPGRRTADTAYPVCRLQQIYAVSGREHLRDACLDLYAGEIVAVAGVSGNGQQALADLLSGLLTPRQGRAELLGAPLAPSPASLVAQGVARIPEDRHGLAVVGDLRLWENLIAEALHQPDSGLCCWGLIRRQAALRQAERLAQQMDLRGAGLHSPTRHLSGGNLQKLVLGRALSGGLRPPRLILAHQPSWGLDVGAVAQVQQLLRSARDNGAAVLLISADLDEVRLLGDRIAVIHAGRLSPARSAASWTRHSLGLAMAGGNSAGRP